MSKEKYESAGMTCAPTPPASGKFNLPEFLAARDKILEALHSVINDPAAIAEALRDHVGKNVHVVVFSGSAVCAQIDGRLHALMGGMDKFAISVNGLGEVSAFVSFGHEQVDRIYPVGHPNNLHGVPAVYIA